MPRPPFATLLLELRKAAGLTQDDLASRAGLGVRTVRDLESGRATRPQRSTVELLANGLRLAGGARERFVLAARGRVVTPVPFPPVVDLVGRDEDAAGIAELLRVADLVTIVGIDGVGKSTLAKRVAHDLLAEFPGGIGAVRVTDASTESELLASVLSVLGVAHLDELAARQRSLPTLVVVSGVEHSCAAALAAIGWLRARAGVRILATARHPLDLPGEHQWPLGPLEVPPAGASADEIFASPATRVFLNRLRRVRPHPVGPGEAQTLAALVRELGGLPLALELAAERGRVLDLSEMLARARAAEPGRRALSAAAPSSSAVTAAAPPPAALSVRAAVYASWDLLRAQEQACLCWLSAFQWRWSMDLAEALLAAVPVTSDEVIASVDRMVGLGLIRMHPPTGGGEAVRALRFSLFDAVRDVARWEAQEWGILSAARDQHAVVIARLCAGLAPAPARTDEQDAWVGHLLADIQAAAAYVGADAPGPDLRAELVRWLGERGLRP